MWFRALNRLAPLGIARRGDAAVAWDAARDHVEIDPALLVRRPFASGLLYAPWTTPLIVLVAVGTASIIFDGLSQTVAFATLFGAPALGLKTLLLARRGSGWSRVRRCGSARAVSPGAIGAGMLPIAVGYLVAHYLTYLLIDGQRILVAVSDPLQDGSDLFGTAFFEPAGAWLPPGLVWTLQLARGRRRAHAGRLGGPRDRPAGPGGARPTATAPRDLRHRRIHDAGPLGDGNAARARDPAGGDDGRRSRRSRCGRSARPSSRSPSTERARRCRSVIPG